VTIKIVKLKKKKLIKALIFVKIRKAAVPPEYLGYEFCVLAQCAVSVFILYCQHDLYCWFFPSSSFHCSSPSTLLLPRLYKLVSHVLCRWAKLDTDLFFGQVRDVHCFLYRSSNNTKKSISVLSWNVNLSKNSWKVWLYENSVWGVFLFVFFCS